MQESVGEYNEIRVLITRFNSYPVMAGGVSSITPPSTAPQQTTHSLKQVLTSYNFICNYFSMYLQIKIF